MFFQVIFNIIFSMLLIWQITLIIKGTFPKISKSDLVLKGEESLSDGIGRIKKINKENEKLEGNKPNLNSYTTTLGLFTIINFVFSILVFVFSLFNIIESPFDFFNRLYGNTCWITLLLVIYIWTAIIIFINKFNKNQEKGIIIHKWVDYPIKKLYKCFPNSKKLLNVFLKIILILPFVFIIIKLFKIILF